MLRGADSWKVGARNVIRILEMCDLLRTPSDLFPDCTDEALEPYVHWLVPRVKFPPKTKLSRRSRPIDEGGRCARAGRLCPQHPPPRLRLNWFCCATFFRHRTATQWSLWSRVGRGHFSRTLAAKSMNPSLTVTVGIRAFGCTSAVSPNKPCLYSGWTGPDHAGHVLR